ncbi:MAG TPA: ferredoxin reductase family protein [Candidatus Binatia bacterium]|nr:ferredoxin reductase family protein [Candidatus Binatia bacterium]
MTARRLMPTLAIVLGGLPGWIALVERFFFGHGRMAPPLLHALGDTTAILGMSLFATSLVLMVRTSWLERRCGGLDRLYRAHHLTGVLAFLILLPHPATVGLRLLIRHGAYRARDVTLPSPTHPAELLGWIALLWLMALMIATFHAKLSYVGWKWLHASAGFAFLVGVAHLLLVRRTSDWSLPVLALWILAGIAALVYRLLIDRGAVAGRRYVVEQVDHPVKDVAELVLRPVGQPVAATPGQFVFAAFYDSGGYHGCGEYHPFTIASTPGETTLRLIVKALGDCTRRMQGIRPGAVASIQGPFGTFRQPVRAESAQVWIAGGIGITPFLAMATDLRPVGPPVDLYYGALNRHEAVWLAELERIAADRPRLRLIPLFAEKGEMPKLERIAQQSGPLAGKEFFICGLAAMTAALTDGLRAAGIADNDIHSERFDFR